MRNNLLTPSLQVRNLFYAYPAPTPTLPPTEVLQDVNFSLSPGEFVALLGRVGAGKSTLCLALSGLIPHATGGVFRGQVLVAGHDTKRETLADLATRVGLVFQDPETQLTQMRVEDEVAFGPENLGVTRAEIDSRVEWALAAVGLTAFRDRSPALLSGGEKQRVTIAATLAMRPQVLVLDEPTSNLDPAGKAAVFAVLSRLAHQERITVLIATQDVERVARYADRALVLEDGRITRDAAPVYLFASPEDVAEVGLGAPQAAELAGLLRTRTGHRYHFVSPGEALAALRKLRIPAPPLPAEVRPATEEPSLVAFEQVSYSYPDGTCGLDRVDFAVERGEFVALVGPNGSGKTTLAKHINGLLKPLRGTVRVEGLDTREARIPALARVAGYVFQNPDHQIFAPTVYEEIAFSLRLQGLPPDEIGRRVAATLSAHGLADFAETAPALLGSGQRRKVSLAAVLATHPQLLILDEPTGGLDRISRAEMMEDVDSFRAAGGTVVLITHDMRLVAGYARRVAVLAEGRIIFDGGPGELFAQRDVLRRAGLVAPPVVRIAQRLWGMQAAQSVLTPQELADAVTV